ncbi:MAG: transporter [Pseudomonadota bacterium]
MVKSFLQTGVCAAAASVLAAPSALGADIAASVGVEATTGDFGAAANTDILIASADVEVSNERWALRFSVPYIWVDGPTEFIGPVFQQGGAVSEPFRTEGVGDVLVTASRFFLFPASRTVVDLSASVKLPTADEDAFLGTGEPDVGVSVDVLKDFDILTVTAGIGYTVSGKSDIVDVQNRARLSVGAFRTFANGMRAGLVGDVREPVLAGLDDVKEISLYGSAPIGERVSVIGYALTGFSDTSPDVGGGLRLVARF